MTAVVFDCDGVIVDSEALSWASWTEALAAHGYTATPADEAASFGRRTADLHAQFGERVSLPSLATFEAALTEATLQRFEAELKPFADAIALLDVLADAGIRLAVASSSSAQRLRRALELAGTGSDRFAAVVSGDDVARGKPAPDIYLRAAELLGVAPSDCWAIEDSPAGVASARAAGMRVVGVLRGHVASDLLDDADLVTERLDSTEVRTALFPT